MKLLVLAAGYATRLRPLTDNQAKPLLPVAGRPMIDHVLDKFSACPEIDAIYVVTNRRYAPNFRAWSDSHGGTFANKTIHIVDDGTTSNEDRLGAIGDIGYVLRSHNIDDDLIVVAGDNLFSGTLEGFVATAKQRGVLVGVYDVGDLTQIRKYNNLGLDDEGRITFFEEKPQKPISTVTADVAGRSWDEILAATMPPGSVSGAPKLAALDVIRELEPVPRQWYCGAFGWIDVDADRAELGVAIRTFWLRDATLHFGTGAGITWGSDPAGEWQETVLKAQRLIGIADSVAG